MKTTLIAALALAAAVTAAQAQDSAAPATEGSAEPQATNSAVPAAEDSVVKVSYACADNQVLQVVYVNTAAGNSYAIMLQQDEILPMQVAISGSGARYTAMDPDYTYELHTKGDEATLFAGEETVLQDCKAG